MIWSTGSNTPMNHPSSEWYLFFEPLFCILNIGSAHVKLRSIVANFLWKQIFLQEVKKINHLHVSFVELTVLHVVGYDLMYLEYTVCSKIRALDHFTIKMQFPSAKTFSNNCVFRAFQSRHHPNQLANSGGSPTAGCLRCQGGLHEYHLLAWY